MYPTNKVKEILAIDASRLLGNIKGSLKLFQDISNVTQRIRAFIDDNVIISMSCNKRVFTFCDKSSRNKMHEKTYNATGDTVAAIVDHYARSEGILGIPSREILLGLHYKLSKSKLDSKLESKLESKLDFEPSSCSTSSCSSSEEVDDEEPAFERITTTAMFDKLSYELLNATKENGAQKERIRILTKENKSLKEEIAALDAANSLRLMKRRNKNT